MPEPVAAAFVGAGTVPRKNCARGFGLFFVSKAVHFSLNHGYSSFLYERSSPMHMSFLFVQSEQFPLV